MSFWKQIGLNAGAKSFVGKYFSLPRYYSNVYIGNNVYLDDYTTLLISTSILGTPGKIFIHNNVYANRYLFIDCTEYVEIGENCMIGPFVYITDSDHDFRSEKLITESGMISSSVIIGRNVWIGTHVCILKGVHIGDNAVIAAGAVVTRNVDAGKIVKGIPAK